MYLDGGLGPARELLRRTVFEQALGDGDRISESDRKSALQEFLQARGDQPAEYRLAGRNRARPPEKVSRGSLGEG